MTAEHRPGRIEVRHVKDPEGKLPDYPGYRVGIAGTPMFLLTFTDDLKGLHWQSRLDFSHLHEIALTEVPSRLTIDSKGRIEAQWETKVIFSSKQGGMLELDLSDLEQLETYRGILGEPEGIEEVRYDAIDRVVNPPFEYHLYANNPTEQEDAERPEIVVYMPKAQPWQQRLIEWARETGIQATEASDVDIPVVTNLLNELSELGPFKNHPLLVDEPVSEPPLKRG